MSNTLTLRSSLKPALKRATLYRGSLLACLGICLLLFGGISLTATTLARWGLLVMGAGLALITTGLLPYQRLTRLEIQPHELLLIPDTGVRFSQHRKPCFTIPWTSIEKTAYIDQPSHYGIAICLKHPIPEKVIVHDPSFRFQQMLQKCRSSHSCDIFVPYFSKRSYEEMLDFFCESAK